MRERRLPDAGIATQSNNTVRGDHAARVQRFGTEKLKSEREDGALETVDDCSLGRAGDRDRDDRLGRRREAVGRRSWQLKPVVTLRRVAVRTHLALLAPDLHR